MIDDHKTGEIKGKPLPRELQYKSMLQREVPWGGKTSKHPDYDENLCWWCQENERIRATPDVIVWCKRCYTLHFKKHDGTYMEQSTIGIGKDLMDINAGKVKAKYATIDKDSGKIVVED